VVEPKIGLLNVYLRVERSVGGRRLPMRSYRLVRAEVLSPTCAGAYSREQLVDNIAHLSLA
jgi:hypothetical protein